MSISRKEELFPEDIVLIRPTEVVRSITDIDFEYYREEYGIRNWGFDIEGTIARGQASHPQIPENFVEYLSDSRARGQIDTLFLLTNRRARIAGNKVGDAVFASAAAQAVDADFSFVRTEGIPGKPNGDMLIQAINEMKLDPLETAYVGDKLTADVRAANEAGLGAAFWVNPRHEVQDHPGDWFIRRPVELWQAHRLGLAPLTPGIVGSILAEIEKRKNR